MYLLVFIILFGVIGYLLANSRLEKKVNQAAVSATSGSKSWVERSRLRWQALWSRRNRKDDFREWTAGPGSALLTEEFKAWLNSLTNDEALAFTRSLEEYSTSLGFDLDVLVEGGLDQQPILRQVFVEAITVYSQAYRKAKQAQQTQENEEKARKKKHDGKQASEQPTSGDGKKQAERQSGRSVEPVAEAVEAPSAA